MDEWERLTTSGLNFNMMTFGKCPRRKIACQQIGVGACSL